MERVKRKLLLGAGWLIIVVGLALGPIPGPGGIPIVAAGAILVLSQSHGARRQFIKLERRFPSLLTPVRKLLRRRHRARKSRKKKASAD